MQIALEKLEELPEDNIFVEANKEPIQDFIIHLEANVEELTSVMTIKESDSYIYITNRIRKIVERIRLV
jgi:hypothetical protein